MFGSQIFQNKLDKKGNVWLYYSCSESNDSFNPPSFFASFWGRLTGGPFFFGSTPNVITGNYSSGSSGYGHFPVLGDKLFL